MSLLRPQCLEPGFRRLLYRFRIPQRCIAPILDFGHHQLNALLERDERLPVEIAPDLCNVGPGDIRLTGAFRYIHDWSTDQLDEPADRLRGAGAQIPDFPALLGFGGQSKRFRDIAGVYEIPSLGPIADHRERFSGELLLEKDPEHRTVRAGGAHAYAVGIEDADRVDRQTVDPVPMERGLFSLIFRERVGVLRRDRVIFAGRRRGNPVTRGRRRVDEFADARVTRRLEHVHGTLDVGVHVLQRTLDRRDDVSDAGEVKYIVGTAKQARVRDEVANVALLERQVRIACVVGQVGGSAPGQVVDHAHAVAAIEQDVYHVAADESGATGHHRNLACRAHFAPSFFMVRTL